MKEGTKKNIPRHHLFESAERNFENNLWALLFTNKFYLWGFINNATPFTSILRWLFFIFWSTLQLISSVDDRYLGDNDQQSDFTLLKFPNKWGEVYEGIYLETTWEAREINDADKKSPEQLT